MSREVAGGRTALQSCAAMLRRVLSVGDDVDIVYLAGRERGTVESVEDDGREVVVVSESAEPLRFRLGATGHFVSLDRRCRLTPPSEQGPL